MAIEDGGEGVAVQALGPHDDAVLHLLPGPLQARVAPSDAGRFRQRRRRVDRDGGAAPAPRPGGGGGHGGGGGLGRGPGGRVAGGELGREEPLQPRAQQRHGWTELEGRVCPGPGGFRGAEERFFVCGG